MRIRLQRKPSRREGAALLIALLALAGLSILGLSLMLVTETELQVSNDERLRKQALYAAEAGIEHALIFMRSLDSTAYGVDPDTGSLGLLSGFPSNNPPVGTPPDDRQSWNEPVVSGENLYDPAQPWKAPALARKGNVLWFCVTDIRCKSPNKAWFSGTGGSQPSVDYDIRDIPFEKSAGLGAWDVGTFKSRYTVYVKNNLDDPVVDTGAANPPGTKSAYEVDGDGVVVLTAEGIVDAGNSTTGNDYYKVVRTVEVTIKTTNEMDFDDHGGAAGWGGTGNTVKNDSSEVIMLHRGAPVEKNKGW